MPARFADIVNVAVRAALVAAAYAVGLQAVSLLVAPFTPGDRGSPYALVMGWLGVFITALLMGPLAARIAAPRLRHVLIWGAILFLNIAAVLVEGAFFAPDLAAANAVPHIAQQFVAMLLAAIALAWLFIPTSRPVPPAAPRPRFSWLWRFVVSAASYLLFYFIFGALNFALVTGPYYQSHAGGLTVPPPQTVFLVETVRAPIMALSLLPFLLTARFTRGRTAIFAGLLLFAAGGIVPLLLEVGTLPDVLLAASAVEIFCQNVSTGIVAGLLLGRSGEGREAKNPVEIRGMRTAGSRPGN